MPKNVPNLWTLQGAKNRFSEVVRAALENGPQTVTRRGHEAVVVVDAHEFGRKRGKGQSLHDFLRNSPLFGSGIDLARQPDEMRELDLSDSESP